MLNPPTYPLLCVQADVEQVMSGVQRLIQLCYDPTNPTVVDPNIFAYWQRQASDRAVGILRQSGWTTDQIAVVATIDATISAATAQICAGMLGARLEEFRTGAGDFPFAPQMKMGVEQLKAKARPEERSTAEDDPRVGVNPRLRSSVTPRGQRIFIPGKPRFPGDSGPGGF